MVAITSAPALAEVLDDRHAERAAFVRVRAGAHSSSSTSAGTLQLAIHRRDVRDVPRERAEARRDRLLVADVGEDRRKTGSVEPGPAGTCSPACAIRASSPAVLSATVLPPVFGPVISSARAAAPSAMSTGTGLAGSLLANRATTVRISNGWRALRSDASRPSCAIDGRRVHDCDKRAFAWSTSSSVAPRRSALQVARAPERVGQREQDAVHLFALLLLERDDVVVDLDGGQRLEEQARAARELPWTMPGMLARCSALTSST